MTEAESKKFHLIPTEIIEAWAKGEYYSGDSPSLSYRQFGTALKLRGWYTYGSDDPKNNPDFRGVAKIDLTGQHLSLGGIRLCGADDERDGTGAGAVRFWRSRYSYFYSETEIVWVYKVYNPPQDEETLNSYNEILDRYIADEPFPDVKSATNTRFGFSEGAWSNLLQKLRDSFDDDMNRVKKICSEDKVLLHYNINEEKGEYRALYSPTGSNIAGITRFKKVFLDEGEGMR